MRIKERIPVFLKHVDYDKLFLEIWKLPIKKKQLKAIKENILNHYIDILELWELYPDLRFSQVLIHLDIIPNYPGYWYYMEEREILDKLNIPKRECYFWGSNFNKNNNPLPETQYRLIKDLSDDHLKVLIDGGFGSEEYKKLFREELEYRYK